MSGDGISIIVPALNEEESVGGLLDEVRSVIDARQLEAEIIVVDDGSTDSTARIAREKCAVLVSHPSNLGYGAALKSGIRKSINNLLAFIDADGTYMPEDLIFLLEKAEGYDMVVGTRQGKEAVKPRRRHFIKLILRILANYLTKTKIPDLNSGMRVVKKDVLMKYMDLLPSGFSFTSTISLAFLTNNHPVCYVPIRYRKRKGRSKVRPLKDTTKAFQLVIRTSLYFNPLKVFLTLGLLFFVPGIIGAIYRSIAFGTIPILPMILTVVGVLISVVGIIAELLVTKTRTSELPESSSGSRE